MAKIYTPVKGYNGVSAGITFRDGVGETSSAHLIKWFSKHGYTVKDDACENVSGKPVLEDSVLDAGDEETEEKPDAGKRTRKAKE